MKGKRRLARGFGFAGIGLCVLVTMGWAALAIYYSNLSGATVRTVAAAAFPLGALLLFGFVRPWRRAVIFYLIAFGALVAW